jgi:hypothetical protein
MTNSLRRLFSNGDTPKAHARRWQRILMSEPARLYMGHGQPCPVMLTQLGAGGARIASTLRLRPKDTVRLEFKTGVTTQHSLTAMVVYGTKDQRGFQWIAGLSFVNVEPKGDPRIAAFVDEERRRRCAGVAIPRA